jgi:CheY-like chemotaxis protein
MNPKGQRPRAVVMVIEDSPETRMLLVDLLSDYKVVAFEDGDKAIEWLEGRPQEKVDLVFSDFNMPGTNGVDTMTRILELRPSIKTVLMSATIVDNLQQVVRSHCFSAYLEKPFSPRQIEGVLEQVLADSGKNAASSSSSRAARSSA